MPKILPKANTIEERWIEKLRDVPAEAELFVPAADKKEQALRVKIFRELIAKLDRDEPIFASRIHISTTFRDRQCWVVLTLKAESPLIGYVKEKDGTVSKVTIQVDLQRKRKLRLMKEDGFTLEQINSNLTSPLTKAEIRELGGLK